MRSKWGRAPAIAHLSLSRVTSGVSGRWLGPTPIYCASRRGNSSPDPDRLPEVDSGHPRAKGEPSGSEECHPGTPCSDSGRTPELPGYRIPPGCTPDGSEWARQTGLPADKKQSKLVDGAHSRREAFTPKGGYSQYGCIL